MDSRTSYYHKSIGEFIHPAAFGLAPLVDSWSTSCMTWHERVNFTILNVNISFSRIMRLRLPDAAINGATGQCTWFCRNHGASA